MQVTLLSVTSGLDRGISLHGNNAERYNSVTFSEDGTVSCQLSACVVPAPPQSSLAKPVSAPLLIMAPSCAACAQLIAACSASDDDRGSVFHIWEWGVSADPISTGSAKCVEQQQGAAARGVPCSGGSAGLPGCAHQLQHMGMPAVRGGQRRGTLAGTP